MMNMNIKERAEELQKLRTEAEANLRGLYEHITHVVLGAGASDAEVMLVGEAPGLTEDKTGVPFTGAAGKTLDALLQMAGLKRDDVYITNVVLCRPPGNRDPTEEEIAACAQYLKRQIQIIRPKLIVALGRFAASTLLGGRVSTRRSHGTLKDCSYGGWQGKLFISYHPAAALYGTSRSVLEEDFKKLGEFLKRMNISSPPQRRLDDKF
jgi:DNA polymerase